MINIVLRFFRVLIWLHAPLKMWVQYRLIKKLSFLHENDKVILEGQYAADMIVTIKFLYYLYNNNFSMFLEFLNMYISLRLPLQIFGHEFVKMNSIALEPHILSMTKSLKISFPLKAFVRLFLFNDNELRDNLIKNQIEKFNAHPLFYPYKFQSSDVLPEIQNLFNHIGKTPNKNSRSVVFVHNCYYNFYYLAAALRKRGWDAICVSVESPESPNYKFYHGEDLNLYDKNPEQFEKNLSAFYQLVRKRYKMVHFYGAGSLSLFPPYFGKKMDMLPWDFLELKSQGIKIGFSHSGCNDLTSQTTFNQWSKGGCQQCIWQSDNNVCSDQLNLRWGEIVHFLCDLVCIETDPQLDYKKGEMVFPDPLTFAIDSEIWSVDLTAPKELQLSKSEDEIIIYHAVGNYDQRTKDKKNFKGTYTVVSAIEKLKSEGHKVKLEFVKNIPSKETRYIQIQADIIVEQLNYGRYGATAREGMMLGIPTISYIDKSLVNSDISPCIVETPIISANEHTIYDVLLDLITSSEKRKAIGTLSRQHALKWWSADACAERFEQVYDGLMIGKSPRQMVHELRAQY